MRTLLGIVLLLTALFLILIVLVQRGRGGGLTGALGGPGGQSAFGSKAGDLFTKITVWVAGFWIVLCIVSIKLLSGGASPISVAPPKPAPASGTESGTGATDTDTSGSSDSDTSGTGGSESDTPADDTQD